jgi:predicted small lipoprotein YifL
MRLILLGLLLCLTLTACGSKGPLYLPEKQYPQGNPNP